jgi:hypothetical protein
MRPATAMGMGLLLLVAEQARGQAGDIAATHLRASKLIYKVDATACRNSPISRTLTGFFLKNVGLVTAAHGVIGCNPGASPAREPFPIRPDARNSRVHFERDLAVLEPSTPLVKLSDGLGIYDPHNPKNANQFMVCGFPTAYSAYMCFPVQVLPGSEATLSITLGAAADAALKNKFVLRASPDPALGVFRVSPWENLGPGLSGAPIMDWNTGDVIAVVDGGLTLTDGRQVGWAIPLDAALISDTAWVRYNRSPRDPRLAKLTYDSLPTELTSSDQTSQPGARPMSASERRALREIATLFARGLLETYPCQWMKVGANVLNTICGAAPCTWQEIASLYMKPINDLKPQVPKTCDAIRTQIQGFASAAPSAASDGGTTGPSPSDGLFTCDPSKAEYWFSDYSSLQFGQILKTTAIGVPAQVALIYNILWIQVPEARRGDVLQRLLAEWEGGDYTGAGKYLQEAKTRFAALAQSCAPGGCDIGIAGATTAEGWQKLSRLLFERWFNYFNEQRGGFVTGCSDTRLALGATGSWEYSKGRLCNGGEQNCYDFGAPRNTINGAQSFADSIHIDEPSLELTISTDDTSAIVGKDLIVSTLVKNIGAAQSGSFQVVLPLPECAEYASSDPTADFDSVTRTASWSRNSLGNGALDAVRLVLNIADCPQPNAKLEFAAFARTDRDKRGVSNSVTLKVQKPTPPAAP